MITAVVRKKVQRPVNRKKVHRIIKLNGWQVWRKPQGKRPRGAQGWSSRASKANERWAVDATHVFWGRDGWCHLTAIIHCCDRNIVGWRLSKTGVAKVAAATLEDALRGRRINPAKSGLTLRSDNGLVFGAKPFVKVVRRYGIDQEYITPYTPEQNGMIERFFGALKSECVWQHRFRDRDHAFAVIARWMDRYHTERPHSALGYLTPAEYLQKLAACPVREPQTEGAPQARGLPREDVRLADRDVVPLRSWTGDKGRVQRRRRSNRRFRGGRREGWSSSWSR